MSDDLKRIRISVNKPKSFTRREISDTIRKEIRTISRIHPRIITNEGKLRDFRFEVCDCKVLEARLQKKFNVDTDPENPIVRPCMTVAAVVDMVEQCIRELYDGQ